MYFGFQKKCQIRNQLHPYLAEIHISTKKYPLNFASHLDLLYLLHNSSSVNIKSNVYATSVLRVPLFNYQKSFAHLHLCVKTLKSHAGSKSNLLIPAVRISLRSISQRQEAVIQEWHYDVGLTTTINK